MRQQPKGGGKSEVARLRADGAAALGRGDAQTAVACLTRAARLEPTDASLFVDLGAAFQLARAPQDAERAFGYALQIEPKSSQALFGLAELRSDAGQPQVAEELLRRAVEADPTNIPAHLSIAKALTDQGKFEEAEIELRAVVAQHPTSAMAASALGSRLQETGKFDEARDSFLKATELDPRQGFAYWGLVQCRRVREEDRPILEQMKAVAEKNQLGQIDKMHLLFALGKAHDDLGDYGPAMEFFTEANRIADLGLFGRQPFPAEGYARNFELTRKLFVPTYFEAHSSQFQPSPAPIYIVGMMRSGTTLVEQILSSHPNVGAGGELGFWIAESSRCMNLELQKLNMTLARASRERYVDLLGRISPGSAFVTDKMPDNYRLLGLLHLLFPNAKFIHCRRHPVDTCLSIYMNQFRNTADYARDPDKLVFMYRQYEGLMEHWRNVLPEFSLLEVAYEDMVTDRDRVTRELLEFCGLDWSDSCLLPEANARPVVTASLWQARQPVYRTSLERWRNYEPWLGAFAKLLSP